MSSRLCNSTQHRRTVNATKLLLLCVFLMHATICAHASVKNTGKHWGWMRISWAEGWRTALSNSRLVSPAPCLQRLHTTALNATCGFIKLESPAHLTASVCLRKVTGTAWSERHLTENVIPRCQQGEQADSTESRSRSPDPRCRLSHLAWLIFRLLVDICSLMRA